ncbi:MAG TPA: hypothetical protein VKU79_05935 [Thermoplasmataceae archaeon]|nr:hypothetical protein [Thermoplasmataceae archaeon]
MSSRRRSDQSSSNLNKFIEQRRRETNLGEIPGILVPVWQIKIRERFGISVDREIAEYIVLAAHERGTWRRQRAIRKIERIFQLRGETPEDSRKKAKQVVDLAVGNNEQ